MEWDIFLAATPVFANNEHMKTLSPQASPLASANPRTVFTSEQASILIRAIVAATPNAALTVDGDGRPKGFTLPGEQEVCLSYDNYKHRIHVSGGWPHSRIVGETHKRFGPWDIYPRPADVDITLSADKAPEKIATEISRRFMPGYVQVLTECLRRRDAHENYLKSQAALAAKISAALGQKPGTILDLPANLTEIGVYGDVEVSGENVGFKIRSLDAQKALMLVEFLKTLKPSRL
jgi:hypothetical protein